MMCCRKFVDGVLMGIDKRESTMKLGREDGQKPTTRLRDKKRATDSNERVKAVLVW